MWTADGLDRAEQHLKRGIGMIGEHADLLAGLAYVHTQRLNQGLAEERGLAEAVSLAERAQALDASSPQAHATRGVQMMVLDGNLPGSLLHLEQAVTAAPADAMSAMWLAWGHIIVGRADVAAPIIDRTLAGDRRGVDALATPSLEPKG